MTTYSFPTDIYYKYSDTCFPHDLQAGCFISRMDGDDLFDLSTASEGDIYFYDIMKSSDLLVISAGTHFDIPTKETRWKVELMSEEGKTMTLISKVPTYDCDDEHRVNYSRQPWS